MAKYKYVELDYENHKATNASLTGHREIIDQYAEDGYRFAGYIPTKIGPSGKILSLDLIFEKAD